MTAFLIGASVSGVMLGATNRIIFLLPAVLMALVVASVLIVRADIDVGLTALTATLFCSGYLLGVAGRLTIVAATLESPETTSSKVASKSSMTIK
jgi:hypothetical protein